MTNDFKNGISWEYDYLHDKAIYMVRLEMRTLIKTIKTNGHNEYATYKLDRVRSFISSYMLLNVISYRESVFYENIINRIYHGQNAYRNKQNDNK